jgi:hypothetical protein
MWFWLHLGEGWQRKLGFREKTLAVARAQLFDVFDFKSVAFSFAHFGMVASTEACLA